MEPVALQAALAQLGRQRQGTMQRRQVTVPISIEGGPGFRFRPTCHRRPDQGECFRLMQGRPARQCREPGQHGLVEALWAGHFAAVHHPMDDMGHSVELSGARG